MARCSVPKNNGVYRTNNGNSGWTSIAMSTTMCDPTKLWACILPASRWSKSIRSSRGGCPAVSFSNIGSQAVFCIFSGCCIFAMASSMLRFISSADMSLV